MTLPKRRGFMAFSWPTRFAALAVVVLGLLVTAVPTSAAPADNAEPVTVEWVDASQWPNGKGVSSRPRAADFPVGNVYCTPDYQAARCLEPLKVEVIYLGCGQSGGNLDIVVRNKNHVSAPRDIVGIVQTTDADYHEFFGDRWWAEPGKDVTKYRNLPNMTYAFGVGWDDQNLAFRGGQFFTVACG